nr:hypothetical protein [Tanacetum cinerariifolium]
MEESHRGLHRGSSSSSKIQPATFISKTNNNANNFNRRVNEIIGYPASFKKNPNLSRQTGNNNNKRFNANSGVNHSIHGTSGSISSSFTNEQMVKLLSLINEKPTPGANMSGWIIDSGANQHMTDSTKNMFSVVDVSSLMLTVGHPNGTLAKISAIGSLRVMTKDIAKQAAHDENLVPTNDRVKITKNNIRIDHSMTQTEETFQVALDILKNVPFYNAFLISTEVSEIYMQQFWFTIEKVKRTSYYKFEINHKTCLIDVDTFKKILNLTPNVENQDFIQPPSSDDLKEFLLNLGYKGMYNNANVDYAAIIWEDLQYQIDYQQMKVRRHEIMPYPRFTKAIIHYFMSQYKSVSKGEISPYHIVDDDGEPTKVTQATKEHATLKKATASSKKKFTKRKLVLKDETI